jgi:hypothetical protein
MASALKRCSIQEIKFLQHYVEHGNGSAAARHALYSEKNAGNTASLLLKKRHMIAALDELQEHEIEVLINTKNRVIAKLTSLLNVDIRDAYDSGGLLLPVNEMPKDVAEAIVGFEVEDGSAAEAFVTTKKIKFVNPLEVVRDAMKFHGLFEQDNKQKSAVIRVGFSTDQNEDDE